MFYKNNIEVELITIFDNLGMYIDLNRKDEIIEMDSLQFICLIIEIENKFDIEVDDEFYNFNGKSTLYIYINYVNNKVQELDGEKN